MLCISKCYVHARIDTARETDDKGRRSDYIYPIMLHVGNTI